MASNIPFNPMANAVIIDKVSHVVQIQPPSTFMDCETIPQLAAKILQCLYETKQVVYKDAVIALEDIITPKRRSTSDLDLLDVKLRMSTFLDKMLTQLKELKSQGITFEDEDACPSYEASVVANTPSPSLEEAGDRQIDTGERVRFYIDTTGTTEQSFNGTTGGSSNNGDSINNGQQSNVGNSGSQPGTTEDQLPSYDEVMTGNKFRTISFF